MATAERIIPSTLAQPERTIRVGIYARVSTSNGTQNPEMKCANTAGVAAGLFPANMLTTESAAPESVGHSLTNCLRTAVKGG